jgi:hypothetical protein
LGEQLVVCVAEEMQRRLERFSSSSGIAGTAQNAAVLRARPLWSGGPGVAEIGNRSGEDNSKSEQPYEMDLVEPDMNGVKPPKSWLERWWSPDPTKAPDMRKASREMSPGVAAYYWTGAAPKAHSVKNISSAGLYVVTEERWYPGTLILMTLQADGIVEHSIAVHSRAVRWGNDGVGLQFILQEAPAASRGPSPLTHGVNKDELDQFLVQLRKAKR